MVCPGEEPQNSEAIWFLGTAVGQTPALSPSTGQSVWQHLTGLFCLAVQQRDIAKFREFGVIRYFYLRTWVQVGFFRV